MDALEDGRLPCSGGERQILRVVASIAEGLPIDLRDALTCLDAVNSVLVARAVLRRGRPPRGRRRAVRAMNSVTITRRRDPLEGQRVAVLRRWRRHGGVDLLVVLPNGRKRLIPRAWTDADPTARHRRR